MGSLFGDWSNPDYERGGDEDDGAAGSTGQPPSSVDDPDRRYDPAAGGYPEGDHPRDGQWGQYPDAIPGAADSDQYLAWGNEPNAQNPGYVVGAPNDPVLLGNPAMATVHAGSHDTDNDGGDSGGSGGHGSLSGYGILAGIGYFADHDVDSGDDGGGGGHGHDTDNDADDTDGGGGEGGE